jgi:hypothetical protein
MIDFVEDNLKRSFAVSRASGLDPIQSRAYSPCAPAPASMLPDAEAMRLAKGTLPDCPANVYEPLRVWTLRPA